MNKNIIKRFILFNILVLSFWQIQAKTYDHVVQGRVVDNMTGQGMPGIFVKLMTEDSVIIDSVWARSDEVDAGLYQLIVHKVGRYIIKAECKGYDDGYTEFNLRSNRQSTLFPSKIRLTKISHNLPEVVVKATKVKMIMQGDTIIYNADAFNLAEGSMLDELIARLPGAKLNKNGQIFVNGKYIQSLLVNGKDFFSGNPEIALENLPAYTVSKIKVYHKEGAMSRLRSKNMGDDSYVMNISLKKEYSKGYIENLETGLGTKNRYRAKALGILFTDVDRTLFYANMNNLNDNQHAELNGEWKPQDVPYGLLTTKEAGLSYIHFLGNEESWVASENTFMHTDGDNQSTSNSQTFLPGGDSFVHRQSDNIVKTTTWNSKNSFYLQKKKYNIANDLMLKYIHNHGLGQSTASTSDSMSVLNHVMEGTTLNSHDFSLSFKNENAIDIIADMLCWNIHFNYNRNTYDEFNVNDVQYTNNTYPRDFRNNYINKLNQQFEFNTGASYDYAVTPSLDVNPGYSYFYNNNKADNLLYRLDKLDGIDSTRYSILPSTAEALASVFDKLNSYRYHEYQNEHKFMIRTVYNFKKGYIVVNLPLRLVHKNMYYERNGRHDVSREHFFFEPNLNLRYGKKWLKEIAIKMTSMIPDLTTMVDYRDNSNPLYIILGNPYQNMQHDYDLNYSVSHEGGSHDIISYHIGFHLTDNDLAYSTIFNAQTGISTVQPVSVDGNWKVNVDMNQMHAINQSGNLTIDNQTTLNIEHNVDMATVENSTESQRSTVTNVHVNDIVKLNYRPNDQFECSLHAEGNYYLIHSCRSNFSDINAGDYHIGVNTQLLLPWKLQLTTDLTMFARRGYQQREMNTTDWIWNAQFTRSLFRGKILVKLQGFDILHQLSSTQYAVNAQGRTESWYNSIPRYLMFSLAWRFNINPKKNKF